MCIRSLHAQEEGVTASGSITDCFLEAATPCTASEYPASGVTRLAAYTLVI